MLLEHGRMHPTGGNPNTNLNALTLITITLTLTLTLTLTQIKADNCISGSAMAGDRKMYTYFEAKVTQR